MDGLDDTEQYFVHEPTLSTRFFYHILPARVIAEKAKSLAPSLDALARQLSLKSSTEIPSILEYNGRTVISTKSDGRGDFALRTKLERLDSYYFFDADGTTIRKANYIQTYAVLQDSEGNWWKKAVKGRFTAINNIYTKNDFLSAGGTWERVSGTGSSAQPAGLTALTKVYSVLCVGANGASTEQPIALTELVFNNYAPVLASLSLFANPNEIRSTAYMNAHYDLKAKIDFDDLFLEGTAAPTNSFDNVATMPLKPDNASYGFCYPQLYGLCGVGRWPVAGAIYQGVSPMHSDYLVCKSINWPGISRDRSNLSGVEQGMRYIWHQTPPGNGVYGDVTHVEHATQWGGFLYTDAADEARTIVTLEFDAEFCHDARVYYTAYIMDLTSDGDTEPIMRVRMSTYNTVDGKVDGQLMEGATKLTKMPVVAFEPCILTENKPYWYQLYGEATIPSEFEGMLNGTSRHYYVEIDNYCDNSMGADYAVDEIRFYTQTLPIKAIVDRDLCEDRTNVKVVADADFLIENLKAVTPERKKTLFYRIYKRHEGNDPIRPGEEVTGEGIYLNEDGDPSTYYGAVTVDTDFDLSTATSTLSGGIYKDNDEPNPNSGFYKDDDGKVYFQLFEHDFLLTPGQKYFVSIYDYVYESVNHPNEWGSPYVDCCSSFSNDFAPRKSFIELGMLDGTEVGSFGNINFSCGETEVTKTYKLSVNYPNDDDETFTNYDGVKFDYFVKKELGTGYENAKQEYLDINATYGTGDLYLSEALEHLRAVNTNPIASSADLPGPTGVFTADDKNLITIWMNHTEEEGKLMLDASNLFTHTFTASNGSLHFAAIPVDKNVDISRTICDAFDLLFILDDKSGGPQITLGFDDVDYPEGYQQVVRVGLEQLTKMKKNGYKLHIPIKTFANKGGSGRSRKLYYPNGNPYLYLSGTNDPTLTTSDMGKKFAKIVATEGDGSRPYVDPDHMYLSLDLSVFENDFHEGYEYEVSTQFYDEEDDAASDETKCWGDLFLIFKVVPEFVTWDAEEMFMYGGVDYYSANWYNDNNWLRSERNELYKGEVTTEATNENHATKGHQNGYKNNTEISAALTNHPGYVPMKFTYVTMLTDNHAPSLIEEPKIEGNERQGGALIDPNVSTTGTEMLTDVSPRLTNRSSAPTTDIRYDMLVRYGRYIDGGEGCHGHRKLTWDEGNEEWIWENQGDEKPTDNVYDVEKFYGNICKEIYFKPGAELLKQQRLTYDKAWVEKEMEANKWYLMSTPLKDTYAGDMYVPVSAEKAKNGRQETEAFRDIDFSTSPVADLANVQYSRTRYPIYQHSWDTSARVYTKTNDIRATEYAAQLNFDVVSEEMAEWGHTYNDVQVPYSDYSGFSIRAQRKAQKDDSDNDVPALIRLPKADKQYDYYQWDNSIPSAEQEQLQQNVTKDSADYARLFDITDKRIEWNLSDVQQQISGDYTYYLIGNPFMSSIDMGKFFSYFNTLGNRVDYNPNFDMVYYTYEANNLRSVDVTVNPTAEQKNIIKPLQAFFVKCKTADAPEKVVFHTDMMTDGNYEIGTATRVYRNGRRRYSPSIVLTTYNGNGSSNASVILRDNAFEEYDSQEDATALFDSNLSDVPVAYTVAGDKAVSIDSRPSLDLIPFGVTCANSDEQVPVKMSVALPLTTTLYVVDGMTGAVSKVSDNQTLSVQPNDYGRYFLTTHGDQTGVIEKEGGIIISVRGRQLKVHATTDLKLARVLTVSGTIVQSVADCGTDAVLNLNRDGIYIVEAVTAGSRKVMTIAVR